MKRRELIALLGSATVLWPFAAGSQQPAKIWRIGILSPAAVRNAVDEEFDESLRQLGWERDRNVTIEYRYTGGRGEREAPLATELAGLGVDLFVTWGTSLALAVMQVTSRNPVVLLTHHDPIEYGVVTNLARPGGNVTGVTGLPNLEILAKRLELLKEVIPSLSRVAVVRSTESFSYERDRCINGGSEKIQCCTR
jgi:putative ABC transport system substrate-binding protein